VQNNFAAFLARRDRLTEAEQLFRAALTTRRTVLGPAHPETVATERNLELCVRLEVEAQK